MLDLVAAVRRSCEAALLAESSINAGHPEGIASLVGDLYGTTTVSPVKVTPKPGESAAVALGRAYAQAGADTVRGFMTELVITLSIAIVGWAQATDRTTEEVAAELLEAVGGAE